MSWWKVQRTIGIVKGALELSKWRFLGSDALWTSVVKNSPSCPCWAQTQLPLPAEKLEWREKEIEMQKKGAKWVCCAGHDSLASDHSHYLSPGHRFGFEGWLSLTTTLCKGTTWALLWTVRTRRATLSNLTPPQIIIAGILARVGLGKRKEYFEMFLMDADMPLMEQTSWVTWGNQHCPQCMW